MARQTHSDFRPPRSPLSGFQVQWDNPTQDFSFLKRKWQQFERPVPNYVQPLLDWRVIHRDNVRLGQRFQDLFYAKLDVGDDEMWCFSHALGRGGFGAVAMFEKRAQGSNILKDQVVAKTTKADENHAVDPTRKDLALEAALMDQTNNLGGDGMLTLRDFKYYPSDCQWKFYFEYCPYGDLERLRVRYKAYGRYLPELFLWHTFYWLARSLLEYSNDNAWFDTHIANWGGLVPNGFLLHSDIKTANILLGPPDPDVFDPISLYPVPRMADLGLAEIQSNSYGAANKAYQLRKGTAVWFPPEIRINQMLQYSAFYPFGDHSKLHIDDSYRKGRHQVTSRHNIWAVGAVMFSLISLQETHVLDDIVNGILIEADQIPGPDSCIITDHDFHIDSEKYYTMALRDLVKDCLKLRPSDRPDEHSLLEQAFNGYTHCLRTLQNRGYGARPGFPSLQDAVNTDPEYKLYFRENEIDSAPDNYEFDHQLDTWWWMYRFIPDYPWMSPLWGRLFPKTMPINIAAPSNWPQGLIDAYDRMRRFVRQERRNNRPPPVQGNGITTTTTGSPRALDPTAIRNGDTPNIVNGHNHHDHRVNDRNRREVAPSRSLRPQTIIRVNRRDDPGFAAIARNPALRPLDSIDHALLNLGALRRPPLDSIDQALLNMGTTRTTDRMAVDRTPRMGDIGIAMGYNGQGPPPTPNRPNGNDDVSMNMGGDIAGVQRIVRPSSRFAPY